MKNETIPRHIQRVLLMAAFSTLYPYQIQYHLSDHKNEQRMARFLHARVENYRAPIIRTNPNKISAVYL